VSATFSRPLPIPILLASALLCSGLAARAQIPLLDPLPWPAPGREPSRAVELAYDRLEDETTHWLAHRVGLAMVLPAGSSSSFFVRAHYVTFDSFGTTVLERWPALASEDAEPGWPFERRTVGFARPEVGVLGQLGLPLLGDAQFALALALPVGREELYPFSAASMPVRLALRRPVPLADRVLLTLTAGRILHVDSGRDVFTAEAYPGGNHLGAGLVWNLADRRSVRLDYVDESFEDARSSRLALEVRLPFSGLHSLHLRGERELAGRLVRAYATWITVAWHLALPAPDSEDAASGR
jgi:hypothetical protein